MAMPVNRHHVPFGHTSSRLRTLRSPDGSKYHVASSPEEADEIKRALQQLEEDVQLVIHGSDEHIRALQEIHAHHEQDRVRLRKEHGKRFDEVENTLRHMDDLAAELQAVSRHAERFDQTFLRFGYSDKIRIMTQRRHDDCPDEDHTAGPLSAEEWRREKYTPRSIKVFTKPAVRQYEHNGILWRSPNMQTVSAYELFIDLIYVGVISVAGDQAAEDATGHSFLRFAIVFLMGWKVYSELTIFMAWFDAEDILRRFTVLWCVACLVGFTTNVRGFYEETYTAMVAFYLAIALGRSAYQLWYAYIIQMIRSTLVSVAIIGCLGAAFWIGSIHAQTEGVRLTLIWIALFIDIFGYEVLRILGRGGMLVPKLRDWLSKHYEFVPGISIEHRVERMGSFVMVVFGYSIISLLFQSRVEFPLTGFLGKAILSLTQVFSLSSIYFEMDEINLYTHAIRRNPYTSVIWSFSHILLTMGFTLSGAALSRIVLAHDSPNTNVDSLYETYRVRSDADIGAGLRWYYCGGLGTTLLSTCIITSTHVYKKSLSLRYNRPVRLGLRVIIAILIILLPLMTDLNSVNLVATTNGLVFLVLLSDLIGHVITKKDDISHKTGEP